MEKTIAFDVDGTLIFGYFPNYHAIDLFRWFERNGWEMYIWSGGGIDYATRWAEKLRLKAKVVEKGSFIPEIAVDDEDVTLGKANIKMQYKR